MKNRLLICLFFLLSCHFGHTQLWRQVKDRIKNKVEQKVLQKAEQSVDNAIDSIGKKNKKTKQNAEQEPEVITPEPVIDTVPAPQTIIEEVKTEGSNDVTQQEGFISITLSADKTFIGGIIYISGKTVLYKDYKTTELIITAKGYSEKKTVALILGGAYNATWNVPATEGEYTITAISSDKKATASKKVTVYELPELEEMAKDNIEQTNKAFANLEDKAARVKPKLSMAHAAELDKKIKEAKLKKDAAIKLFTSIAEANKKLATLAKKGRGLPRNLSQNLSELNSKLTQQSEDIKRIQELANHEPLDNSICEYLVMLNEACAAFSTFTNVFSKSIGTIIKNIVLDKVIPATIGGANEKVGSPIPSPLDFPPKEAAKLYATSLVDAESLVGKLGTAGITGDMITFITEVLMKIFCGVYKGELTHNYTMTFINSDGKTWWRYAVEMTAAVSLRYPKSGNTGRVIKMKGNIEGNATKFTFFADAKEAMADELKGKGVYNQVSVIPIFQLSPLAVPFSTALSDKLGFGAIARALVTPAYFNIPIDAEYDQDAKKIKILVNSALIDFTPAVFNQQAFMIISVLPMIRYEKYPVEKAEKTIRGSFKGKNIFPMVILKEGEPSFSGTVTREIAEPDFTINLLLKIKAKKE
jgi:hypothetical protein